MTATTATAVPGLHASPPEVLPFAPELRVRAYLLERERGNLLVNAVPGLAPDAPWIAAAGGVARQYLVHGHEAMFASPALGAPLFVHEADRAAVERTVPVRAAFSRRHTLDDDFEAIPIPGHTPGSTAYRWRRGGRSILFTGDSIYLDGDEWVAAVLGSSDRAAYIASLELLREVEFDVLVPWAATAGRPFFAVTDPADARARIDAILTRLRAGGRR